MDQEDKGWAMGLSRMTGELMKLESMKTLSLSSGPRAWARPGFRKKPAWPRKSPWARRPMSGKSDSQRECSGSPDISKLHTKTGV
jgi:hypothetical protein